MYVNYGYYESRYLLGRNPVITEEVFSFWEKQAVSVLISCTFGRVASNAELVTDDVKDCVCELAELLYQADVITQQAAVQGGILQSYSNDGESGTFDLSQSTFTEEGKARKAKEIIYRYLGHTGLLYRGM